MPSMSPTMEPRPSAIGVAVLSIAMNGDSGICASRPGTILGSLRWSRRVRSSFSTTAATPRSRTPGTRQHVEQVGGVAVDAPRSVVPLPGQATRANRVTVMPRSTSSSRSAASTARSGCSTPTRGGSLVGPHVGTAGRSQAEDVADQATAGVADDVQARPSGSSSAADSAF